MNTWPAIPTGAISSPRNAPTTIPAARPNRTCVARLILALLRYFPGGSMGEVLAQGDAGHQGQFTRMVLEVLAEYRVRCEWRQGFFHC